MAHDEAPAPEEREPPRDQVAAEPVDEPAPVKRDGGAIDLDSAHDRAS